MPTLLPELGALILQQLSGSDLSALACTSSAQRNMVFGHVAQLPTAALIAMLKDEPSALAISFLYREMVIRLECEQPSVAEIEDWRLFAAALFARREKRANALTMVSYREPMRPLCAGYLQKTVRSPEAFAQARACLRLVQAGMHSRLPPRAYAELTAEAGDRNAMEAALKRLEQDCNDAAAVDPSQFKLALHHQEMGYIAVLRAALVAGHHACAKALLALIPLQKLRASALLPFELQRLLLEMATTYADERAVHLLLEVGCEFVVNEKELAWHEAHLSRMVGLLDEPGRGTIEEDVAMIICRSDGTLANWTAALRTIRAHI